MRVDSARSEQPHESLRELANTTRDAVLIELQPLQQELAQVRTVLQEAGSQLQVAFLSLNAQTRAQVAHVRKLQEKAREMAVKEDGSVVRNTEASLRELDRITALVGTNIDDAVRAFQFEDIATQLLECAQRRLSRVDALAAHLQNIAALLGDIGEAPAPGGSLVRVRLRLARMRQEYATTFLSPVAAPAAATDGEIEMF
jgi:hypothetical protein